jgi:site-specific DNA-methyltransferase (adenine-specific)/adenine-specific DNA-methyltransferase
VAHDVTGVTPRLDWPGKPDRETVLARARREPPARLDRTRDARLFHGDNAELLAAIWGAELRLDLIYVDPPFATEKTFPLRGDAAVGAQAPTAYRDTWRGGRIEYLTMMYERLVLMHEVLSEHGCLYVHLDANAVHYVKVMLDEIFGLESFQREIVWRVGWISGYKSRAKNWIRNHDTILFYTKDPVNFVFNKQYVPHPPGYRRRGGGEGPGHPLDDVWNGNAAEAALKGSESLDSIQIKSFSDEKTGFPTQKNESLLRRILQASSRPGDLVGDFFCGSGTTLVAAEGLGRRWIGCDISADAVRVAQERLEAVSSRAVVPEPVRGAPTSG